MCLLHSRMLTLGCAFAPHCSRMRSDPHSGYLHLRLRGRLSPSPTQDENVILHNFCAAPAEDVLQLSCGLYCSHVQHVLLELCPVSTSQAQLHVCSSATTLACGSSPQAYPYAGTTPRAHMLPAVRRYHFVSVSRSHWPTAACFQHVCCWNTFPQQRGRVLHRVVCTDDVLVLNHAHKNNCPWFTTACSRTCTSHV